MSAAQSQISVDKTTPAADGVEVTTVYVAVQQDREDANWNALPVSQFAASNVTVTATPSTGVTITQPTGTATQEVSNSISAESRSITSTMPKGAGQSPRR